MNPITIINVITSVVGFGERIVEFAPRVAALFRGKTVESPTSPRDIAIATKSAVSADREGKIAAMRAEQDAAMRKLEANMFEAAERARTGCVGIVYEHNQPEGWLEVIAALDQPPLTGGDILRASKDNGTHVSHRFIDGEIVVGHKPRAAEVGAHQVIRVVMGPGIRELSEGDSLFKMPPKKIASERAKWNEFQRLWSEAVGKPGYVKADWMAQERYLFGAERNGNWRNPPDKE